MRALSAALLSGCPLGAPAPAPLAVESGQYAIIGGHDVKTDDIAGVVAVVTAGEVCTGTLIAPATVMTAAHCLYHYIAPGIADRLLRPAEVGVIAGVHELDLASEENRFGVIRHAVHPDYGATMQVADYDVGILELSAAPDISVTPVLPFELVTSVLSAQPRLSIFGYGTSDAEGTVGGGVLREARVPLESLEELVFIAGHAGTPDGCLGDSGGPAYVEVEGVPMLAGILAEGVIGEDPETYCGYGGIYAIAAVHMSALNAALQSAAPMPEVTLGTSPDASNRMEAAPLHAGTSEPGDAAVRSAGSQASNESTLEAGSSHVHHAACSTGAGTTPPHAALGGLVAAALWLCRRRTAGRRTPAPTKSGASGTALAVAVSADPEIGGAEGEQRRGARVAGR